MPIIGNPFVCFLLYLILLRNILAWLKSVKMFICIKQQYQL